MPQTLSPSATVQAPQAAGKGESTRHAILEAASRLFSERGYEGTGIRDIEQAAGVNRGVVTYHLGNKEAIWKAVVEFVFGPYVKDLESKKELILALEPAARRRFLLSMFVRTSALRPRMNDLMIQENLARTWRIDWIVERYLIPMRELFRELSADDPALRAIETDANFRYVILGACIHAFSIPREVESLFGEDVFSEAYIERHIETILSLFENRTAG